eukprot:g2857.t1
MEQERLLNDNIDDEFEEVNDGRAIPTVTSTKEEFQVNLEGGDWLLTTLLITLDAILLLLYQSDDTKWATFLTWFWKYDCDSGWLCQLFDILFIMTVTFVNVSLLIPIIYVNVRTPSKIYWRYWVFIAWLSVILVDAMTILQFADSIRKCINGDDDNIDSWTAHFCLVISAVVATILLNVRFFYLYRIHSCFTCSEDETLKNTPGLVQIYNKEYGIHEHVQEVHRNIRLDASSHLRVFKTTPKLMRFDTTKFVEDVGRGFSHFIMRKTRFGRRQGNFRFERLPNNGSDRSFVYRLRQSSLASKMHHAKGYIITRISQAYYQVAEVENIFEYSSWMKSAAAFAVLMLIYNCIKTTEIFYNLASAWDDYHKLALRFQHELHHVEDSLIELSHNLTEVSTELSAFSESPSAVAFVNASLPESVHHIEAFQETLEVFEKERGRAYDLAGIMLDVALITTAKLVNITELKDSKIVGAFFYIDSIIPIIKYTCMVGYPIGTFIGLNSIYHVLVQHKRMSLGLEQALAARTSTLYGRALDDEDAKLSLLGIEKKYQIGGAVYFFGILMTVIVDIKNFDVLLNIGGYIIFVYLFVLISNLLLTHLVGDRLLTQEGFHIRHPWTFFLYLFTFSMVHAVLGYLYAFWRALLLLITTFWVLNRLDISLFLAGKQLDNGHYSFMSMLLLTRVIRLTNISQGYIQLPASVDVGAFRPSTQPPPPPPPPAATSRPARTDKKKKKTVAFRVPEDDNGEESNDPEINAVDSVNETSNAAHDEITPEVEGQTSGGQQTGEL